MTSKDSYDGQADGIAQERLRDGCRPPRLTDWWLFLRKFIRHGTAIGAVAPSSMWMARAVLKGIDFDKARFIVELGPGTGPISAELRRRAHAKCRLFLVERDADFRNRLKERFPNDEVIQGDACDLELFLARCGVQTVDHIVSGLPLPWFTPQDRERLLDASRKCLAIEGSFRQLTYMPWVHGHVYRRYFHEIRTRLVFRNLPPAAVYVCQGPR
jgi:phospholipid N-methyltransferase